MLRVPIEQLKPGMVLARSVANPKKLQHTLLKAGFKLDDETIKRLRLMHVCYTWVNYPKLDFLDQVLDPDLTRQQQELYGTLKEQFTQAQGKSSAKIDYAQYTDQMTKLFTRLLANKGKPTIFIGELQTGDSDIFLHDTTVAYLAVLVGMRLQNYVVHERPRIPVRLATDLTNLGLGCLLHDIGKLNLPKELQNFQLTAQNLGNPDWQNHTDIGFEMVQGGLDPTAAQIVLNHHQHFDGSGFPARKPIFGNSSLSRPLRGEEIHIFCRIAALADRFDGFRHMPDGTIAPPVVALKRLRKPGYNKWFDPVIFPVFVQTVPPFPPGELVTLNNGQTVVVTELNENHPCKPIVRPINPDLAVDSNLTTTIDQPDINLATRTDLHIARMGEFDVTPYLH
jgi:HD-GYP domain-containing protein (c-di-GMP phosphodiesterase class II)